MALESIAALSLAGNMVQLIDFGCRLLSNSRTLYKSSEGVLAEILELESIATSLRTLSEGRTSKSPQIASQSPDESILVSLAQGCKDIADEFLQALDELRVKEP